MTPALPPTVPLRQKLSLKLGAALTLAVLANFTFPHHPTGFLYGLYAALLPLVMIALNPALIAKRSSKYVLAGLMGLALALFYAPSSLAILLYLFGVVALLSLHKRHTLQNGFLIIFDSILMALEILFRAVLDRRIITKLQRKGRLREHKFQKLSLFAIPVLLGSFFILLFISANPLLGEAFLQLRQHLHFSLRDLLFLHLPYIFIYALVAWAILRPHFAPVSAAVQTPPDLKMWINPTSLVLSLILFNLIFVVQNSLDILFLWSGQAELPHGLSYAQYAHSGAYPLIITALLAAAYVLIVFSEHQKHLHTPAAEKLVYLWIAQNVFLVISSVDRLLGYISVYSLTYLRLAALIWMGLIIIGLLLIMVRILRRKTNAWLINTNMMVLGATLYVCCFINLPCLITSYNLTQATQSTEAVSRLDLRYIRELGEETLPALANFLQKSDPASPVAQLVAEIYPSQRSLLELHLNKDWRAWTAQRAWLSGLPPLYELRAVPETAPPPQTP